MHAGIYKHRKGGLYLLLGTGHDADHEEREVVVYVPLYTDPDRTGPRLAVRTRSEFEERFEFMGEHYEKGM